jgi:DNA modification methylase
MARPDSDRYELTDADKRDLIKLIEQGKPLPEKYRFILFDDKREVELVWNGKSREVCTAILPFQTLEHIDEPRKERGAGVSPAGSGGVSPRRGTPGGTPGEPAGGDACATIQPDLLDMSGRQIKGWTNKLIWGDNKLILSSLKSGALRRQIEDAGGLKLIYIDPPFDVGADFSMDIEIGGETFHKEPNLLEQIAYRDTWGRGADSFIAMIYERLILMRDLMHSEASIYVHSDWRMNALIRLAMTEVFGANNFINEIVWKRRTGILNQSRKLGASTDSIYLFSKSADRYVFNQQFIPYTDDDPYVQTKFVYKDEKGRRYRLHAITSPSYSPSLVYEYKGYKPPANGWSFSRETMEDWERRDMLYFPEDKNQRIQRKQFLDESDGKPVQSLWDDIRPINSQAIEDTKYPTQKTEELLERIVETSSNEGDLVADFFCGSGTTAAVAEKLGRKWIATDLGKFGIHTTRKRLIQVQREIKAEGKPFRAFEVLNLGRYERQAYLNVSTRMSAKKKAEALANKEREFRDLILKAYRAEPLGGGSNVAQASPPAGSRGVPPRVPSRGETPPEPAGEDARATSTSRRSHDEFFHGKISNRLVVVGPINLPVGRLFVEEVITECRKRGASRVDVLAFEFEMGLFPAVLDGAHLDTVIILER